MNLRGKQRLVILAIVAVLLVGGLAVVNSRASQPARPAATGTPNGNINGGTTATAAQVQALKSYGLQAGELPIGTSQIVGEEVRNYAAGQGAGELRAAQSGRIDGFYQVWQQDTAHMQFQGTFDLYDVPASAEAVFTRPILADPSSPIQMLDDPKLGDASRMYAFSTQQGGAKYEGWAVQWVRGRTIFDVRGLAPPGELQQSAILSAASAVDARAQKTPIK